MPGSADRSPFAYLVLRVVPSVERGERLNVGVVVFCRQRAFLALRARVDAVRLAALAPTLPSALVAEHLAGLERVAAGDPAAGPIAVLPASERFGWLAAPSSTIIAPSEVHTGLSADPARTLDGLFGRLVAVEGASGR